MFGDQIISQNENVSYFALEQYLEASKEEWTRCQESMSTILAFGATSKEDGLGAGALGVGLGYVAVKGAYEVFAGILDTIIDFFKYLVRFILNLIRSQVFKIKAQAIYKKIGNLYRTGVTSELNWDIKINIPKSINVKTDEIIEIVNSIKNEDSKDTIAYNVHKNKPASASLNTLTQLRKYSTDDSEKISVGEALKIISENDKGVRPIAIGNLKDVEAYIKVYANHSAPRLQALVTLSDKAQRKLRKAIRHKEKKLADEETIDDFRSSAEICDICTKLIVKNINFAFKCINLLLDSYKPKYDENK